MGTTIGVVGTGNMGVALLKGWLRSPDSETSFVVYDVVQTKVDELAVQEKVTGAKSIEELVDVAQAIVLTVKPKDLDNVLGRMRPHLREDKVVISSAAGVPLEAIRSGAGQKAAVFRIMPNLGVALGQGVVAVTTEAGTDPALTESVLGLLAPLGLVESVSEGLFDAITAVSGSSLAFLAVALEAMEDGGVRVGMPRPMARAFVRQTALAGCQLLQASSDSAAEMKDQVTSPGGTTIAGLAVLEDGAVRGAFVRAIEEATERSRELRDASRPH